MRKLNRTISGNQAAGANLRNENSGRDSRLTLGVTQVSLLLVFVVVVGRSNIMKQLLQLSADGTDVSVPVVSNPLNQCRTVPLGSESKDQGI